ncbi:hypothetical protein LV84_04146 [Algoriphagus ratkowskyi]|uniref:Uncharacterized protein n=1 Tax=Algoriphagus ratkowskyi TaxID=57028 RepID=A0A2W7QRY4_9BACT|nr:hypothetical protein [Algoriphagus ratkowskyi]PZX49956.1 hypothetical protein LV84_04146 [Algoriphagus ratkowskyi]TXD75526.1 hypothetical protein ESW18_20150 [Algoriphagus ratkowskyi]
MVPINKGDTQDLEKSVLIPKNEASHFKESIVRILGNLKLENCSKVQQTDIKNIYKLLEYFSDKE